MNWIRRDLKDFKPYKAGSKKYALKLDANESPFSLSENVRKELLSWIENDENLNIYPDSDCDELRSTLSLFWNVQKENMICGVGSDQIIDYITKTFIEPGDVITTLKPTFSMYSLSAVLNHGKVKEIETKDGFLYNVYDIIKETKANKSKILFLCTPNNPTGNSFSIEELKEILKNVDCPVVVDEAYAEFSDLTMIPYINEFDNLIVLRTFSKSYGLAGARIGYAIASKELIDAISIVKAPYNVNSISQLLATLVLKDSGEYKRRVAILVKNKDELYNKLKMLKRIKVFPSDANFLFIESQFGLSKEFEKEGIIVRKFDEKDKFAIRLTIGTKDQNDKVYKIIEKLHN